MEKEYFSFKVEIMKMYIYLKKYKNQPKFYF
ncbi:Uncharacterised protein [Enterococcus casseliflavus]|nr:Uncharacterised protein [Enterococcus casseliflavus]